MRSDPAECPGAPGPTRMLLDLTPDQELFRDATVRFLEEQVPPVEIRRLRDNPCLLYTSPSPRD